MSKPSQASQLGTVHYRSKICEVSLAVFEQAGGPTDNTKAGVITLRSCEGSSGLGDLVNEMAKFVAQAVTFAQARYGIKSFTHPSSELYSAVFEQAGLKNVTNEGDYPYRFQTEG